MKKILLVIFALVTTVLTIAQENKHEVSVYVGGGYSSLNTDINFSGKTSSSFGPLFGIDFTYKLNSEWGLISGLEMAVYKSDVSSGELKDRYITQDNYGNNFEWRLAFHNIEDNLKGTYLNIPLMVQFTPGAEKFYANLGFKVGIPMSGKYTAQYSKLVTSGYYIETGAEYTDIDFRGFGEFGGSYPKGDIDFGIAFILSAECGMKWKLTNSINLYTGGYIDYGLNNIIKGDADKRIISYNKGNPTDFDYSGLMESKYTNNEDTKPFMEKIAPLAFGLKIKLGFSL